MRKKQTEENKTTHKTCKDSICKNTMNMNIGTLNLCLGLKNKKEEVKGIIFDNKNKILSPQETELESNYPKNYLLFKASIWKLKSTQKKLEPETT